MVGRVCWRLRRRCCSPACGQTVAGTLTWPGATLEKVTLTGADLEAGVQFDRIHDKPGQPDGAGGPGRCCPGPRAAPTR